MKHNEKKLVTAFQKTRSRARQAALTLFDIGATEFGATGRAPSVAGYVLALIVLAFAATACYAASIDLGFSADGAYYFARILDDRTFINPTWSRLHAVLVVQWPLVLAVKAGVTSLPVLKALFHLGPYLPFFLSFLICCYASRALNNNALLLFPLASYLLVSLPAASIFIGESHVLAVIVWPILFLLLQPRLTFLDSILLVALLLLMSRTYETAIAAASIFLCLLAVRLSVDSRAARPVLLVATAVTLAALAIALYWSIFPGSAENRTNFIGGLIRPARRHPMLIVSAGSMFLLAWSLCAPRLRMLAVPAFLLAAASITLPAFGLVASAYVSFNMRQLTLTLLPLLLLGAVWFHLRRPNLSARQWVLAGIVFSFLSVGYAASWTEWRDFRRSFMASLEKNVGYVPLELTSIAHHRQRWRWTMPLLSVLWSRDCVRTVILNKPSSEWEPFDPRKQLPLSAYVSYSPPFAYASAHASRCN